MNHDKVLNFLHEAPVIAAIKNDGGLEKCLSCDAKVVFVLYGTVMDIPSIVNRIHQAGKLAIVHIDLIDGLATRDAAVDFIAKNTGANGIISTKPTLVRRARENRLVAIRRFFLLDSIAMHTIQKQLSHDVADFIEVLPGLMPKILRKIAKESPLPIIAGGLISDKEDVVNALSAGAVAISSTDPAVWYL